MNKTAKKNILIASAKIGAGLIFPAVAPFLFASELTRLAAQATCGEKSLTGRILKATGGDLKPDIDDLF